jgi:hypothetical protein
MHRQTLVALVLQFLALLVFTSSAHAIDGVAEPAQNPRWHCSDKTGIATFLQGDKPETARLILVKASAVGQTLTVTSDASYIALYGTNGPHVVFKLPPNPDGTTSTITLFGGDQPTVTFNGKDQVQQDGKWIQIFSADDKTFSLELGLASFATVKLEKPDQPKPAVAAPLLTKAVTSPAADHELMHLISPDQMRGACNAFDQGIHKKCEVCGGTGRVSVRVQFGSLQEGIYSVPQYRDQEQRCARCQGSGVYRSRDEVLIRLAGKIVKDLAALDKDDPASPKVLTDAYDDITRDMIGDQKAWRLLTANGRSILAQRSPKLDTAVVSLVQVEQSIPHDDQRRYLVRVLGTDKRVYVDNPVLADELTSGRALMGGTIGTPEESAGEKTTVLRGGFLIAPPIDGSGWWWSKD